MLFAGAKPALASAEDHFRKTPGVSWQEIGEPVHDFLEKVSQRMALQVGAFEPAIAEYAQYALTNQGKQLRPSLVALGGGAATGKISDDHVSIAVIIEMVHLATLVHDDIMDAAEIRRRRPTLAAHWGNEISVLVGDCLFAHALTLASDFPTTEICRAVSKATRTVCTGEILQTHQRGRFDVTREEYFKVLAMKTAELFALSCELGAAISDATETHRQALRQYGMALGTAYQIYDDCLDVFGAEAEVGKSLGTDLACGKPTLPLLVAWERVGSAGQKRLRQLLQPWNPASLGEVLEIFETQDVMTECRKVIHQYLDAARQHLDTLAPSTHRNALNAFADFLAQQTGKFGV